MAEIPASSCNEDGRFRLVNALTGDYYALPNVGSNQNWTVLLTDCPEIRKLRGMYLWQLEKAPDGNSHKLQPSRSESGSYVFSEAPVHAVLDSCGKPSHHGPLIPDTFGCIRCVFGIPGRSRGMLPGRYEGLEV